MNKAKVKACNVGYVVIFLMYILPALLNNYNGWNIPSAWDGGFRGVVAAVIISIIVYLLSDPKDS